MIRVRVLLVACLALSLSGCLLPSEEPEGDLGASESLLSAEQRRARAGQIRDAAAANGITQGWLLAGIADTETNMSHCWSELTWACMGPASTDCGGGPVVAGAGDGPCDLQQGGLGMFQFDAGTYADTLAREGNRILSISGNVAAAVDFVIAMVIRSSHISGVDTAAQAVDWINGVRIGNERWDAWITTVTHYYNGCAPTYSCFSAKYASYGNHTINVYNEMGASFWTLTPQFAATYVNQTFPLARDPFELVPGQEVLGYIEMRNAGTATWRPGQTNLGTTMPRDVASAIAGPDWLAPNRPATIDRDVPPGASGRFHFTVRAPAALGEHPQYFNLVQEGAAWFSDQGGPIDNQLQVRVSVVAPTLVDADGDGADSAVDCNDGDPGVHPGALDPCGDGVDQDCSGADTTCPIHAPDAGTPVPVEGDAAVAPPPIGRTMVTGCSAAPSHGRAPFVLVLFVALGVLAKRRKFFTPKE